MFIFNILLGDNTVMESLESIINIAIDAVIIKKVNKLIKPNAIRILHYNRVIKHYRQILAKSFKHNIPSKPSLQPDSKQIEGINQYTGIYAGNKNNKKKIRITLSQSMPTSLIRYLALDRLLIPAESL